MPGPNIRIRALSAVAYAGMFVFGIVMALLGAVLPALTSRLDFNIAAIGALFLVMNFAMLVTSLVLGVTMDRFGMKPPLALGPWLVGAALVLIATASRFEALWPAVVLLGIGGGALNGATNTLIADLHEDPRRKGAALNLLGVFFGFGALFLPFMLGALLMQFGFAALLWGAALLCAAVALYAAVLRFPAPKQAHGLPVRDMPRFLAMPVVLAMAFLLFFQSGNEFLLGGFISTFVTRQLGTGVETASWILAAYWASIMAARVLLSRVLLRFDGHRVILLSAAGSMIGAALIGASASTLVAAIGAVVTGFSLSGIFPTLLGVAASRFPEHSGTVFGILFTIALTGGMTMPWLAGQLGESAGLRSVFILSASGFFAVALLNAVVARAGVSRDELSRAAEGS